MRQHERCLAAVERSHRPFAKSLEYDLACNAEPIRTVPVGTARPIRSFDGSDDAVAERKGAAAYRDVPIAATPNVIMGRNRKSEKLGRAIPSHHDPIA